MLGVIAKLDLVEVRGTLSDGGHGNVFTAREVVPVDYKAGAPREGVDVNELWPTDQMQLGLQTLPMPRLKSQVYKPMEHCLKDSIRGWCKIPQLENMRAVQLLLLLRVSPPSCFHAP